jgi:hypothetical protein
MDLANSHGMAVIGPSVYIKRERCKRGNILACQFASDSADPAYIRQASFSPFTQFICTKENSMTKQSKLVAVAALAAALTACSSTSSMMHAQNAPSAVAAPAGNKAVMTTVGVGELTYECRAKAGSSGAFEWVFAGPNAVLYDANRNTVGKYYGGPTWEAIDGSKVTGKQLAAAPSPNPGAIPLQLVQANPAMGKGAMTGVTYVQRLNTIGGVAPTDSCNAANIGAKKQIRYQADYVFYKTA